MAYALVQHKRNEASSATNVTVTPNAALTIGNCLVVVVWEFAVSLYTISNIQDQSNNAISFSVIGSGTSSGSNRLIMAVCQNLPVGVTAVKVTVAGSCTTLSAQIVEFAGLKISGAIDVSSYQVQTAVGTTTDAISSGSVTPTAQPALVFAATRNASGSPTPSSIGTGFTSVGQGVNALGSSEHRRITSTSSIAGTFTAPSSGDNHVTGVVVLLEDRTVFADDFNRADEFLGPPNWTVRQGSLTVRSNAAAGVGANAYGEVAVGAADFANDHEAEITVTAVFAFDYIGPAVRVSASGCYAIRADGGNVSDRRIVRMNGTTLTTIGNVNIVPVANDVLKLRAVGSTITAYKNGVVVDTVIDSTHATGQPGYYYNRDNINATRGDNFYASDVLPAKRIRPATIISAQAATLAGTGSTSP